MSRYQKLALLIFALILVALIALVAVVVLKPASTAQRDTPARPLLSEVEMTNTWAADFAATHVETIHAIGTFAVETATHR